MLFNNRHLGGNHTVVKLPSYDYLHITILVLPPGECFFYTQISPNLFGLVVSVTTTTTHTLLLLVCVSFTIIGQPRNSVLIRRV